MDSGYRTLSVLQLGPPVNLDLAIDNPKPVTAAHDEIAPVVVGELHAQDAFHKKAGEMGLMRHLHRVLDVPSVQRGVTEDLPPNTAPGEQAGNVIAVAGTPLPQLQRWQQSHRRLNTLLIVGSMAGGAVALYKGHGGTGWGLITLGAGLWGNTHGVTKF